MILQLLWDNRQYYRHRQRSGMAALLTAIMLVVLLGVLALALDIGWITMTKTQLRAASDAGALGGGTELVSGLGPNAIRTPAEVEVLVRYQAVRVPARNRAGDRNSVYIDGARDVTLGQGRMNPNTNRWEFNWGAFPYNAVRVIAHRDFAGSSNGDGPLPLLFARAIGRDESNLVVLSTAVIMPASGIRIPPDSGVTSNLTPFAFEQKRWKKYFRAQAYFKNTLHSDPALITPDIMDNGPGGDGTELFFEKVPKGSGSNFDMLQRFNDAFRVIDPESQSADNIVAGTDGVLEVSIYPLGNEPGNFGTVDIGSASNGTPDLRRQILNGPSEEDLSYHENNEINPSDNDPITLTGDTGISSGMKDAIEAVIGQCRAILLFDSVSENGNNAEYVIVDMVGTRWVYFKFTGKNKVLVIQPCAMSDPAGVPDLDEDVGDETTFFTPLILAQ